MAARGFFRSVVVRNNDNLRSIEFVFLKDQLMDLTFNYGFEFNPEFILDGCPDFKVYGNCITSRVPCSTANLDDVQKEKAIHYLVDPDTNSLTKEWRIIPIQLSEKLNSNTVSDLLTQLRILNLLTREHDKTIRDLLFSTGKLTAENFEKIKTPCNDAIGISVCPTEQPCRGFSL